MVPEREAEGGGKLQQEAEVVVGVVALQRVQGQDRALAPFEQALFAGAFVDGPVEDLAHEERHRVLAGAGAQARQRMARGQRVDAPEVGSGILRHLGVQDVEGLEERHPAALGDGRDETAAPPVGTEGVQDQGAFPDLGGVQDDEPGVVDHQYCLISGLAMAWRSASS